MSKRNSRPAMLPLGALAAGVLVRLRRTFGLA